MGLEKAARKIKKVFHSLPMTADQGGSGTWGFKNKNLETCDAGYPEQQNYCLL